MKLKNISIYRAAIVLGSMLAVASLLGCSEVTSETHHQMTQQAAPVQTVSAEAMFAFDIDDQRKVAGGADAVFVGTVLEQLSSVSRMEPFPETQFSVHVNSVLKGDVTGDITVSQQGGFDPATNTLLLMEDDPLLEVGSAYIFSTNLDPASGWHNVTVLAGHIPVSVDSAERMENGPAARGAVVDEPAPVAEMRESIENQINPYAEE